MTAQRHPPDRPERIHADPYPPDLVPLEPVRAMRDRETREELRTGRSLAGVLAFAAMLAVIAILAIAWLLVAAPRADPDARRSPAALTDPGLPGAPQLSGPGRLPSAGGGAPQTVIGGPLWAGTATWYCGNGSPCTRGYSPGDMIAAIDTDLGIPKGETVVVRAFGKAVTVRVVDVCLCAGERLIDLSAAAFRRLAPLEYGVIPVTIEIAGARGTLPLTETKP